MTDSDQQQEPQHGLGLSADEVPTTTRAVRKRLDLQHPVPREVIEDCVRVAVQAPSGRNRQRGTPCSSRIRTLVPPWRNCGDADW